MLVELVENAKELVDNGFIKGTGGNVSVRRGGIMFISPSGRALDDLDTAKLGQVDIKTGEIISKDVRPSSEYLMHLKCYQNRPEVRCVIHTHPIMVQSLCGNETLIPMFADYHVFLGRNVPHVPYITVTTPKLAKAVEKEIKKKDCNGIVLRNHGIVTVGETIKEAVYRTYTMEENANIQFNRMLVSTAQPLPESSLKELDMLESEDYRKRLLK
jgi:L-fuculose-phosphate aldolase